MMVEVWGVRMVRKVAEGEGKSRRGDKGMDVGGHRLLVGGGTIRGKE